MGKRSSNDGKIIRIPIPSLTEERRDEKKGLDEVQKITDNHIRQIDELQKKKDVELLGK